LVFLFLPKTKNRKLVIQVRFYMPKIKTHRGAAKRFKATAGGRVKHKRPFHSHILTSKSTKRKRQQRRPAFASGPELKSLKRLLPYL